AVGVRLGRCHLDRGGAVLQPREGQRDARDPGGGAGRTGAGRSQPVAASTRCRPQRSAGRRHARGGEVMIRTLMLGAALMLAPAAALSAQLGSFNPEPGPRATVVIRNARIFPVSGPMISNGSLLISDGVIRADLGRNAAQDDATPGEVK